MAEPEQQCAGNKPADQRERGKLDAADADHGAFQQGHHGGQDAQRVQRGDGDQHIGCQKTQERLGQDTPRKGARRKEQKHALTKGDDRAGPEQRPGDLLACGGQDIGQQRQQQWQEHAGKTAGRRKDRGIRVLWRQQRPQAGRDHAGEDQGQQIGSDEQGEL